MKYKNSKRSDNQAAKEEILAAKQAERISKRNAGFTLVELSIVLVIIGLIISGVLVGRDLIQTASIRAAISQIDSITAAGNTFRGKYGGLPGDLYYSTATAFGLTYVTSGGSGKGDGNGVLYGGATSSVAQTGETTLFWRQLFDAGLISTGKGITTDGATALAAGTDPLTCFPPSKINGNYLIAYSDSTSGVNYIQIAGITTMGPTLTIAPNLKPQEAYGIDLKMDDGIPDSGNIKAGTAGGVGNTTAAASCFASSAYAVGTTYANTNACELIIKMLN